MLEHAPLRTAVARSLLIGTMLASAATPVSACSLTPPWEYRRAGRIEFVGTPVHDTVFAGPGIWTPTEGPGHFGPGRARAVYGQRVRVDRMTTHARRVLPAGVREVVLVPWDYGVDCATVPWSRSAGFLPDTLVGVFAAYLRPRAQWAGDLPTLDLVPFLQPYRDPPTDPRIRDWWRGPRLSAAGLMDLYDALWEPGATLDSVAAQRYAARLRADSRFAGRYPATVFLEEVGASRTSSQ